MIFVTGDMHSDWLVRLDSFGKDLTKNDILIICGDFGIWHDTFTERYELDWLDNRNFTTVFVDGNHENFDRLDAMSVEEWNGGKVHKVMPSVIHLMRGQVYTLQGYTFFTFGGAQSHDIKDGILDRNADDFLEKVQELNNKINPMYRVNHESWWERELPSEKEMQEAICNLAAYDYKVDYIITHCPGTSISAQLGVTDNDAASRFIQKVRNMTTFKTHFFGHMHIDAPFYHDRAIGVYERIIRIA